MKMSNSAKWGMALVYAYFGAMILLLVGAVVGAIITSGAGWQVLGGLAAFGLLVAGIKYVLDRHNLWGRGPLGF